jgi:hypothetical protein
VTKAMLMETARVVTGSMARGLSMAALLHTAAPY